MVLPDVAEEVADIATDILTRRLDASDYLLVISEEACSDTRGTIPAGLPPTTYPPRPS